MTLITSKKKIEYQWKPGDLIGAKEAAELLGYKSAITLQDATRRASLKRDFEAVGCALTEDIWIGGGLRFLRSEIDLYISKKIELARNLSAKRNKELSLSL